MWGERQLCRLLTKIVDRVGESAETLHEQFGELTANTTPYSRPSASVRPRRSAQAMPTPCCSASSPTTPSLCVTCCMRCRPTAPSPSTYALPPHAGPRPRGPLLAQPPSPSPSRLHALALYPRSTSSPCPSNTAPPCTTTATLTLLHTLAPLLPLPLHNTFNHHGRPSPPVPHHGVSTPWPSRSRLCSLSHTAWLLSLSWRSLARIWGQVGTRVCRSCSMLTGSTLCARPRPPRKDRPSSEGQGDQ